MIKSIILAAGKGTRMKSDMPKVLHTIFEKTLLGYVIDAVNNTGIADENFVIVGHQAERVEEYINKNYDSLNEYEKKCIEKIKQKKKELTEEEIKQYLYRKGYKV